jgi:hypothetical protein
MFKAEVDGSPPTANVNTESSDKMHVHGPVKFGSTHSNNNNTGSTQKKRCRLDAACKDRMHDTITLICNINLRDCYDS